MTPAEYSACDAVELARLVRGKDVSPRELLEAAVQCIEAANPNLNAVTNKLYDRARAAIDVGLPDGPLRGVPFLLKDLGTHWRGTVSSYGSAAFRDFRADDDCEVVKRYTAAGLTIMGKTNTSEFGLSTSTEPHLFGPTRNPWSGDHSAGGSSGGAAAAVASCVVPIAEGTDAGGSIRIPASSCGVFGMKPTRARTPYGPQPSEGWAGATVIHALARSVRDSAALLDCTRGPAAGDPYGVPEPERPYLDEIRLAPGRLRIALATSCWTGQAVHPDCSTAAADAARLCESLGHIVEPASPALDGGALAHAMHVVISSNIRATLANRSAALGRVVAPDDVERITWKVSEAGGRFSAADYINAVHSFQHAGRTMGQFFREYDILLTPTQCVPPPRLGVLSLMNPDTHRFNQALWESLAFTFVYNVSGCPAMSVPLHRNAEGLPVGVQFGAAWAREATLYRLAAQLETTDRWTPRTGSPVPPGN